MDKEKALKILNEVLKLELSGAIKYTQYGFMIKGLERIWLLDWCKEQAEENLSHARKAGEMITSLGAKPSLEMGRLENQYEEKTEDILKESLKHEEKIKGLYEELLGIVEGKILELEGYAWDMIMEESKHIADIKKLLN